MSAHAALGVVRAGVAVLKGTPCANPPLFQSLRLIMTVHLGTSVRINCISPGQIDVGIDLKGFDMRGMKSQLPPAALQSTQVSTSPQISFFTQLS